MSEILNMVEAHRELLLRLTAMVQLDPRSNLDGLCRFCGIRPRVKNLCMDCDARRERLAQKFPDVPPPAPAIKAPIAVRSTPLGMTALGSIDRPEWTPHNSE